MAIFGSPRRGWNIKNIVLVKIFEKIVYIKLKFYCTHIMGFTSPSSVILFFFKTSNDFSSTTIFNFFTFHFWSIDKYRFWIVFISVGIMRHALLLAPLINIWRRWRSARTTSLLYRPPGITTHNTKNQVNLEGVCSLSFMLLRRHAHKTSSLVPRCIFGCYGILNGLPLSIRHDPALATRYFVWNLTYSYSLAVL